MTDTIISSEREFASLVGDTFHDKFLLFCDRDNTIGPEGGPIQLDWRCEQNDMGIIINTYATTRIVHEFKKLRSSGEIQETVPILLICGAGAYYVLMIRDKNLTYTPFPLKRNEQCKHAIERLMRLAHKSLYSEVFDLIRSNSKLIEHFDQFSPYWDTDASLTEKLLIGDESVVNENPGQLSLMCLPLDLFHMLPSHKSQESLIEVLTPPEGAFIPPSLIKLCDLVNTFPLPYGVGFKAEPTSLILQVVVDKNASTKTVLKWIGNHSIRGIITAGDNPKHDWLMMYSLFNYAKFHNITCLVCCLGDLGWPDLNTHSQLLHSPQQFCINFPVFWDMLVSNVGPRTEKRMNTPKTEM
jgi:hypothetical protein